MFANVGLGLERPPPSEWVDPAWLAAHGRNHTSPMNEANAQIDIASQVYDHTQPVYKEPRPMPRYELDPTALGFNRLVIPKELASKTTVEGAVVESKQSSRLKWGLAVVGGIAVVVAFL